MKASLIDARTGAVLAQKVVAKAEAIGPILMGMGKPVHVLQRGVEVADIVNMAALAVVEW